uniref:ATP synthase subunit b n=2 Tax=Terrapene triunguis TaxID=2587831 RepID=A0A674JU12_9SAUR
RRLVWKLETSLTHSSYFGGMPFYFYTLTCVPWFFSAKAFSMLEKGCWYNYSFFLEKVAQVLALKNDSINHFESMIEQEKKEQWRVEGRNYLFDAKRNNVAMLLETNYRERLLTVYNEVKKRLDYQIAVQQLARRKEQDHMINWIEKNVVQSITPQQVL